jgi:hypothetical protein
MAGSLVLNLRATDSYRRRVAWSADGDVWSNASWTNLPEPGGSCEGAMARVAGGALLMSAPFGVGPDWDHRCAGPGRCNMTVWTSWDSGASWGITHQLNETVGFNPRDGAAYSSLAPLNATHFALVYERELYRCSIV